MMMVDPEFAAEWITTLLLFTNKFTSERMLSNLLEVLIRTNSFETKLVLQPEFTQIILNLTKSYNFKGVEKRYCNEFFGRLLRSGNIENIIQKRPEYAITWIKIIRSFREDEWFKNLDSGMFVKALRQNLANITLGNLEDLQWFARVTNNNELIHITQRFFL
jgi:hypothetical protein